MNLNGKHYIPQFLSAAPGSQVYNDAAPYGVRIQEAQVADGEQYWRVIGVHHLLPAENGGALTTLVEALDENGNGIREGRVFAASTWEGRQEPPDVKALDKGSQDPAGCDFPLGVAATYSIWIAGPQRDSSDPSDRVVGLHTRHADEAPGNTWAHHSYYVVFQRSRKGPTVLDQHAMLKMARGLRDEQTGGNSPFHVYAREHKLGAPITAEFSAGGFRARGFVGGVVFAPLANVADVAHAAW